MVNKLSLEGAFIMRPLKIKMEENNPKDQENKTPSKMARLAWPKAKYGVIIAIIIIVVVNLIYYKDAIKNLF